MKRFTFHILLGAGLLAILMNITSGVQAAQAATQPSCAVLEVTLHGTAAPTTHCRMTTRALQSISPHTVGVEPGCYSTSELELFWNGPIGVHPNYLLCLNGTGLLNLNQPLETSPDDSFRNWNDQASAWWTGCRNVTFYKDINRGGAHVTEPGSTYGRNSPQGIFPLGGIGNDQLSSIWLDPGPAFCE